NGRRVRLRRAGACGRVTKVVYQRGAPTSLRPALACPVATPAVHPAEVTVVAGRIVGHVGDHATTGLTARHVAGGTVATRGSIRQGHTRAFAVLARAGHGALRIFIAADRPVRRSTLAALSGGGVAGHVAHGTHTQSAADDGVGTHTHAALTGVQLGA